MSNREEFLQELYSLDSFDDSLNDKMNWACINGWDECVAMLIEKGADGHLFNDYPLTVASSSGHTNVVRTLIDAKAGLCLTDRRALYFAAGNGHLDIVNLLLQTNTEEQESLKTCLLVSCQNGHANIVKTLLDAGAEVDPDCLKNAMHKEYVEIVELLVTNGCEPRSEWSGISTSVWNLVDSLGFNNVKCAAKIH